MFRHYMDDCIIYDGTRTEGTTRRNLSTCSSTSWNSINSSLNWQNANSSKWRWTILEFASGRRTNDRPRKDLWNLGLAYYPDNHQRSPKHTRTSRISPPLDPQLCKNCETPYGLITEGLGNSHGANSVRKPSED